jgi:hypothetical protein
MLASADTQEHDYAPLNSSNSYNSWQSQALRGYAVGKNN